MISLSNLAIPILWIHIAAGMVAFFIGPGAMLTRKGSRWHRRWGKIFFWSMAVVALTALLLTFIRPNIFLTLVAIFSFYSAFSGYRVLYRKRPDKGQKPGISDWTGASLTLLAGFGLLTIGIYNFSDSTFRLQPIFLAFGFIGSFIGGGDIHNFLRPFDLSKHRNNWFFQHMGNMIGAYIAAVTAFSATNFHFLPLVVRWLWPSVVFIPLLQIWTRRYRKQFAAAEAKRGDRRKIGAAMPHDAVK